MKQRLLIIFLISSFVLVIDRISKELALVYLQDSSITIIPGFFKLFFIWNPGIAFGLLGSYQYIVTIIVTLIVLSSLFFLHKIPKRYSIGAALMIGGAIGNLTDRLIYGKVIDYFSFISFPIFNVADVAISIGFCLLLIQEFKESHKKKKSKKKN